MTRAALAAFLILLGSIGYATADDGIKSDAVTWLKRISTASRQINYAGTFVYRHANQSETSRIVHWADASGEYEKLEVLDGPPREIVRNNDNVTCYLPQSKTVIIEKRTIRRFPSLLPEQFTGISENYTVRKGEQGRVAGYDCQVIALDPKDELRYGHKFCVEIASGLPLRASMYNEKNELVESFAFTQLAIGSQVSKDMLKSRYAAMSQSWHVDKSALQRAESSADTGWVLTNQPVGFKKLTEMKRWIAGRATKISHIVYSDGLAAVSIFIEPLPKSPPPPGPSYQGAVNIYVRSQADQMLTVVGETPARTVKQIAESLSPRDR